MEETYRAGFGLIAKRFGLLLALVAAALFGPAVGGASATPTVTSISPNNGTYAGGTTVTITGTGFTAGSTVAFGASAGTSVTYVSSTKLTAKSPAGPENALVDIKVTTEGSTSGATPVDQFAYDPAPSGVWLGLNSNSGNLFGYKFQEHNIKYDRSWHLEVYAGTLPTSGSTFREALENSINNGMKPIVTVAYNGSGLPTGAALTEYVTGFVATAKAARELYPKAEILFEAINEPYFRGGTELAKKYANIIAALLPEAQGAGIPLSTIYVAAWGYEPEGTKAEWIPTMYSTQPSLKTLIQGWNFHPYGLPGTGTNPNINMGIMNVPTIQAQMTSGQNNIIISEVGFCAEDLGYTCPGENKYNYDISTSTAAAGDLSEVLGEAKTMHEAGWLRAVLVYSRGSEGFAMVLSSLTAQGSAFVSFGNEQGPTAPLARTEAATQVQDHAALLNGTVDPEGTDTHYSFEWGTTTSYGHNLPAEAEDLGTGIANITVDRALTGLLPSTKYHFRVKASSSVGTTYGSDATFTTTEQQAPAFAASFGSVGSAEGQFRLPADIARDASGNLWVVDESNCRVEEFSSAGKYLTQFGSCGSTAGQLLNPSAIAIDSKGNIWVADEGHIQKFTEKGEYSGFRFGSFGTGTGQFQDPEGLAIDSSGNIWVSDTGNNRVVEFNEKGESPKTIASFGTGAGQVNMPEGIDFDANGNVWVVDRANNRVEKFNSEGTFKSEFGSEGTTNGKLHAPDGITIDSKGVIWIGDVDNNRVEAFNEAGEYLTQFGTSGSGAGQFSMAPPMGLASDSNGELWVTDSRNNRVQKWILPEDTVFASSFGALGSAKGLLHHPTDVVRDAKGNLWVTDQLNSRVEEFSSTGQFLSQFGSAGTGGGQFNGPRGIAIDPKGNIWVADAGDHIQKFTESGEYSGFRFGSEGSGATQFEIPAGLAIDSEGHIWVADTGNNRVEKFSETGELLKVAATFGKEPGQVAGPASIDIDANGNVWVVDKANNRVEEFSSAGTFKLAFGSEGSTNGKFKGPDGIAVDSRGVVWVGDIGNNRVEAFTEGGEYLTQFGTKGSGLGQLSLEYSLALSTDSEGNLWVVDSGNNRIQKGTH